MVAVEVAALVPPGGGGGTCQVATVNPLDTHTHKQYQGQHSAFIDSVNRCAKFTSNS